MILILITSRIFVAKPDFFCNEKNLWITDSGKRGARNRAVSEGDGDRIKLIVEHTRLVGYVHKEIDHFDHSILICTAISSYCSLYLHRPILIYWDIPSGGFIDDDAARLRDPHSSLLILGDKKGLYCEPIRLECVQDSSNFSADRNKSCI